MEDEGDQCGPKGSASSLAPGPVKRRTQPEQTYKDGVACGVYLGIVGVLYPSP